jgi:alpha-D-ribose 1-methylphosphonate 5-triphosphate synthase subunit PhnH
MKLDPVHDIQRAFRELMKSWAYPGEIVDLSAITEAIDIDIPINRTAMLLALVLIDAEVGFCVDSSDPSGDAAAISRLTYGKRREIGDADFVFVLGKDRNAGGPIAGARIGTLVDPQLGSTLVVEVGELAESGPLVLSGPGIRGERRMSVGLDPSWIAARAGRNREFPLGVDLVFVDGLGRLASLPRTTQVGEGR